MARTRDAIETLVEGNTGKTDKDSLMHARCDDALKVAQEVHTFEDCRSTPSDVAITEDATSCALPTGTREIISVRIVDSATDDSAPLPLKTQTWWDKYVITPEDNMKGWPKCGLRFGSNLILDRPADANLTARFRISTIQTFTDGDTECPIELLDIFVEYYVTAHVFLSIEDKENFVYWMNLAKAELQRAIAADERRPAVDRSIESPEAMRAQPGFSTTIDGTNFSGDFASLGTASWFGS